MNMFNYYNSDYLYSLKPKRIYLVYIMFIVFISIFISTIFIDTYDVLNIDSYIECDDKCHIYMSISPNTLGSINKVDYLSINDIVVYHYELIIEDIENNNNMYYQNIEFLIDNISINNKTVHKVKIYYNKERIFKKIINNLFK